MRARGTHVHAGTSTETTITTLFADWVISEGGDQNLLDFLSEKGFASKLSLQYLDLKSDDGQASTPKSTKSRTEMSS